MNTLYAAARAAAGANESTSRCQVHKNSFSLKIKPVTPNVILRKDLRKGGKDHEDRPIVQGLSARAALKLHQASVERARCGRKRPCVFLARRATKPSPQGKCVERKGQPPTCSLATCSRPADAREGLAAGCRWKRPPLQANPVKSNCAGSFCLQTSVLDLHKKPAFKSTLKEKDIQW